MHYEESEIARKFGVSNPTVGYWIKGALEKKNNLILEKYKDKYRILEVQNNEFELSRLATLGEKHIPKKSKQDLVVFSNVQEKFYNQFSVKQQIEIFSDIKYKKQLRYKYVYLDGLPPLWDEFYKERGSKVSRFIANHIQDLSRDIIKLLGLKKVNLIEFGPGNAYPTRYLLDNLIDSKLFDKYIGLDISKGMLEIAKRNIFGWFGEINSHYLEKDFEADDIFNTLMSYKLNDEKVKNLIFFIGNTICNLENPEKIIGEIASSMSNEDIFVFSIGLFNSTNVVDLTYMKDPFERELKWSWAFRSLGIDLKDCEISHRYEPSISSKIKTYKLLKDYQLNFTILQEELKINLFKNEEIIGWKHKLFEISEIINLLKNFNLEIKLLKTDETNSNAVLVCQKGETT